MKDYSFSAFSILKSTSKPQTSFVCECCTTKATAKYCIGAFGFYSFVSILLLVACFYYFLYKKRG